MSVTKRFTVPYSNLNNSKVTAIDWWLVSHLSGCLMAFCPKILGGDRDLSIIILLKNECSFTGSVMLGDGDTLPLQHGEEF